MGQFEISEGQGANTVLWTPAAYTVFESLFELAEFKINKLPLYT